jgi:hypothetical protein
MLHTFRTTLVLAALVAAGCGQSYESALQVLRLEQEQLESLQRDYREYIDASNGLVSKCRDAIRDLPRLGASNKDIQDVRDELTGAIERRKEQDALFQSQIDAQAARVKAARARVDAMRK